jgi:hypothetical protein
MSHSAKKTNHNEEIVAAVHTFSNEAFTVAKSFVAGSDAGPLKQKAGDLKTQLPKFAARMQEADQAYRADLNRVLSEAHLDLEYVLAGGGRPSSIRLSHVICEQSAGTADRE